MSSSQPMVAAVLQTLKMVSMAPDSNALGRRFTCQVLPYAATCCDSSSP